MLQNQIGKTASLLPRISGINSRGEDPVCSKFAVEDRTVVIPNYLCVLTILF
jgi:hypothetical protein